MRNGREMKRGTIDHPKLHALAAALKTEQLTAVGVLESLFHFAAAYALPGDIGRHTNEAIAAAIRWPGDANELIRALTVTGWIDPCACHRLRIHDWNQHADQTVQRVLANRNQKFCACYDNVEEGQIYCIQQGSRGPIKIGWSREPRLRLEELQIGNPTPLRLVAAISGTRSDESELHTRFAHLRIAGEWFSNSPEILRHFGVGASMDAARSESIDPTLPLPLPLPKAIANTKKHTSPPEGEASSPEREIFDYWRERTGHKKAQFTPRRRAQLKVRLKEEPEGVAGLKLAVDGAILDPWYNGSRNGHQYWEFENIFVHEGRNRIEKLQNVVRRGQPKKTTLKTDPSVQEFLRGAKK